MDGRSTRRRFLAAGAGSVGALALGPAFWRSAFARRRRARPEPLRPAAGRRRQRAAAAGGLQLADRRARQPAGGRLRLAHLPRRRRHVRAAGRRLGPDLQLRVAGGQRRRHLGDPLPPRRQDRLRLPDPRRHERELRRRPDPVGHVAVVRGVRRRPRLGVRSAARGPGHDPPGDGHVQPRGGLRRPGRPAGLHDRGPARRRALPLHAGRVPRPVRRAARGAARRRRLRPRARSQRHHRCRPATRSPA